MRAGAALTRATRVAATLTVLVALSPLSMLTACSSGGGGGSLSKSNFISDAGKICTEANKKIRALAAPDLTDPQATSRTIRDLLAIQHREVDDLRGLDPPKTDRPAISKWLGFVSKALDEADAALTALEHSDQNGVNAANARGGDAQLQADDLARDYGITRCVSQEVTPPTEPGTP
jgi:hypothetical protein